MKKGFKVWFLILVIFASLILAGCGTPGGSGGSSSSGTTAKSVFTNIITFKFLQDVGLTTHTTDPIEGFVRFLLLIVFFLVLYKGAQLLKLGQGSAVAIALVFGLIGMIFVPGSIILAAAASYGTIFSLVILGLPVMLCVGMYFFLKDNVWMRTLVVGMLWLILSQMWRHMQALRAGSTAAYQPVFSVVTDWIIWVQVAVAIFFFISLIQAITSLSSGHSGSDLDVKGTAQHWWNKINTQARRNKTSKMNQYIEDQVELERLEKTDATRKKAAELVELISSSKQVKDINERNKVVKAVKDIKSDLDKAKTEFSRVFSKTRRQQSVNTRAVDQLKSLKGEMRDKEKDIEQLEVLEKLILEKHKEGSQALDKALGEYVKAAGAVRVIELIPDAQLPPTVRAVPLNLNARSTLAISVNAAIVKLLAALNLMETHLKTAEGTQKEAIQAMTGASLEARELMMWK